MTKNNRKKAVAQAISTAVALGWVIMQGELAQAATLTVNNLNDNGVGSLRDTINIANNNDVVEFLLESHPSTINLTSGALAIAKNLTINGPGANLLTITGNNHFPVFDINADDVKFSGLAIAGDIFRLASAGDINASNSNNLTFTNSTVNGDNFKIDSNLRLINSTISSNNIEINANDVTLTDHSHLVSSNNTVINANQVDIQDRSNIGTPNGTTSGGTLTISTDDLGLNNDGQINTGSNNLGAGGDITITTSKLVVRDGATVSSNSGQISNGLGGNISLNASDLLLLRRAPQTSTIAAGSNNSGVAGNITLNSGLLTLTPGAIISKPVTEPSALAKLAVGIAAGNITSGAGGDITLSVSSLSLTRVPEPSAIAGSILACSLALLAKRKQAEFCKAKV